MAGKQGATWSKPMTQQQRDSLALSKIEELLDKQVNGKKRLSPSTLMALRIRYDKLRPALSSVEQTVHNADDQLSDEQLLAKFDALVQAHPALLERFIGLRARAAQQQPAPVEPIISKTGTE